MENVIRPNLVTEGKRILGDPLNQRSYQTTHGLTIYFLDVTQKAYTRNSGATVAVVANGLTPSETQLPTILKTPNLAIG